VNLYSAFFVKKNPKHAACARLVEREEKGFEVAPKRWNRRLLSPRWAGSEFQFEGPAYAEYITGNISHRAGEQHKYHAIKQRMNNFTSHYVNNMHIAVI